MKSSVPSLGCFGATDYDQVLLNLDMVRRDQMSAPLSLVRGYPDLIVCIVQLCG